MAFKGILKGLADEVGRQIDKKLNPHSNPNQPQQQYYGGGPGPGPYSFGGGGFGGGSHPKVCKNIKNWRQIEAAGFLFC